MKILIFILAFLSLKVSAADDVKNISASQDRSYGIVLSKGKQANDFDVLISRKIGRLYSFKYCSAHDAKGQPTKIFSLRKKFMMGELEDTKNLKLLIEDLFSSQECGSMGHDTYAVLDKEEVWDCNVGPGDNNMPKDLLPFILIGPGLLRSAGSFSKS